MSRSFAMLLGVALAVLPSIASADSSWMFSRSYSSHVAVNDPSDPGFEEPLTRAAYRPAIPQRGPGFSVRAKNRINIYRLNIGQSWDTTIYREFSVEESAQ